MAASLPVFSPSYGHTYIPPASKPAEHQLKLSQRSKENTPVPGSQSQADNRSTQLVTEHSSKAITDTQTLLNAIRMTLNHGNEYMDETPLVGEPGNFRLSKNKENPAPSAGTVAQASQLTTPVKERTPATVQVPSPPPQIETDASGLASRKSAKGGERSPTTPGGMAKPKRRKSKAAISFSA